MKLSIPELDILLDNTGKEIHELVIENPKAFYQVISEMMQQIQGEDGSLVLSVDGKEEKLSKRMELLTSFIPFDINRKPLINKITQRLITNAVSEERYSETVTILGAISQYLEDLSFDIAGDIRYDKISIDALLKGIGVSLYNDYDNLCNQLIDYFELVREYEADKVFVLVNLRSYIDNTQTERLIECVLQREYQVILLESMERGKINGVSRIVVDRDLCVIQ